ncbi:hypothetical protein ACFL5O_12175 [Myxococcota bacterium]
MNDCAEDVIGVRDADGHALLRRSAVQAPRIVAPGLGPVDARREPRGGRQRGRRPAAAAVQGAGTARDSLARRDGARQDVLERITHNAAGDIMDRYTAFDWEPLSRRARDASAVRWGRAPTQPLATASPPHRRPTPNPSPVYVAEYDAPARTPEKQARFYPWPQESNSDGGRRLEELDGISADEVGNRGARITAGRMVAVQAVMRVMPVSGGVTRADVQRLDPVTSFAARDSVGSREPRAVPGAGADTCWKTRALVRSGPPGSHPGIGTGRPLPRELHLC